MPSVVVVNTRPPAVDVTPEATPCSVDSCTIFLPGEGFIDVTQQIDPDHYERIARIESGSNARTSVFVPEWHRLYVAVPRDKERSAELRVYETVR